MRLYFTPTSPFVRKVLVTAHELALIDGIHSVFLRPSPLTTDETLSSENPLNKIPTLVLDDGAPLYDSAVICEYLDSLPSTGPKMLPASGAARWTALRRQALSDGILEAGVQIFYERTMRPKELQWEAWMTGQAKKALQGLDALELEAPGFAGVDLGLICVASMIGWLEFRSVFGDVRAGRPELFAWYDEFAKRPSMTATAPKA